MKNRENCRGGANAERKRKDGRCRDERALAEIANGQLQIHSDTKASLVPKAMYAECNALASNMPFRAVRFRRTPAQKRTM
jgi:hypothetical protein